MSRRIVQFGSWVVPAYLRQEDMTVSFRPTLQEIVGADGAFDQYGNDMWPRGVGQVNVRFALVGDSEAELDEAWDTMAAALAAGRQKLYMELGPDGPRRWTWAKASAIPHALDYSRGGRRMELEVSWLLAEPVWYSDRARPEETITSSPHTWTVTNSGNARNVRPIVTIKAGAAGGFKQPTIQNQTTGEEFRVMYPATSNQTQLRIDAGARTVEVSEDAGSSWINIRYALVLPDGQSRFFSISAGDNTLRYSDTAATPNVSVAVDFADTYN